MQVVPSLRHTAAAVTVSAVALVMVGFGVGVATPVASATTCSNSPSTLTCFYRWKITRVSRAHVRRGSWHNCVSFSRSRHTAQATCALGQSRSTTVTATLTGTLEVPRGTLSAAVGYQVQQTSSVTASYTATIPPHRSGRIQWAPLFNHRHKVQQQRSTCRWVQVGRNPYAYYKCSGDDVFRYVYTEQYSHPRFRVRYHG